MAGPKRTKIRIGELNGAPYVEQISFATPADMELLKHAKFEIEIEDGTAFVTIFLQIGDGSPTAITHSPVGGGKYDVGAVQAARTSLGIDKVSLCVHIDEDDDDTPSEEEDEDEGDVDTDAEPKEGEEVDAEDAEAEDDDDDDDEGDDDDEDAADDDDEDAADEDEGPSLGELADSGDKAAIKTMEALGKKAGIDCNAYETYVEVEKLLPDEDDDDGE